MAKKHVQNLEKIILIKEKFKRLILGLLIIHPASICVRNSYWKDGRCQCRLCKRPIAISYKIGDDIHIFKFPKFKRFAIGSEVCENSFIGELSFRDMDDLIEQCKQIV